MYHIRVSGPIYSSYRISRYFIHCVLGYVGAVLFPVYIHMNNFMFIASSLNKINKILGILMIISPQD